MSSPPNGSSVAGFSVMTCLVPENESSEQSNPASFTSAIAASLDTHPGSDPSATSLDEHPVIINAMTATPARVRRTICLFRRRWRNRPQAGV